MMATKQNTPSVIAKLMGFEDAPHQQQPVYRQQRVSSENYQLKSASLCLHENRSSKIRQKDQLKIKKNSRKLNNDCFDGTQALKSRIIDSQTSSIEERNLVSVKNVSKPLFLPDSRTIYGWEFKKQLLERSKKRKVCNEIWSNKSVCNRVETRFMVDIESKKRFELRTRVVISSNENKLKDYLKSSSTYSEDIGFSCSSDVTFQQDSSYTEGFRSLNCIDIEDEISRSTGEAYQPSPNSVLEPDNSSSSEYGDTVSTDLHGLWMKLHILMSESEENQLKPQIMTSNEEDASERSFPVGQTTKPITCFGPQESQQYFYLVNVLNELGIHENVEVCLERFTLNPMIFETLEKKYGYQNSWSKADKRLLFDRINLGLTEMVWSKPLRRKMGSFLRRDVIEEELWNMLLSQEKEVNVDLSEKAVGKEPWLDLGDDMDNIVGEIEAFLFNEFVAELIAI